VILCPVLEQRVGYVAPPRTPMFVKWVPVTTQVTSFQSLQQKKKKGGQSKLSPWDSSDQAAGVPNFPASHNLYRATRESGSLACRQ